MNTAQTIAGFGSRQYRFLLEIFGCAHCIGETGRRVRHVKCLLFAEHKTSRDLAKYSSTALLMFLFFVSFLNRICLVRIRATYVYVRDPVDVRWALGGV